MEALVEVCCGLDVHQATVVACLLIGLATGTPRKEIRTFATNRAALVELRDWLVAAGCTVVAMESTGIYWRPVYEVLEGHVQLVVGNAQHIKNVPGRKTDVKDCEWIARLTRHGLVPLSFVPPRPIRVLRDLTRYRRKLVQTQAAERNRLLKVLEAANIKLAGTISDVFGKSGRDMVRALIAGETSTATMAEMARRQMRRKRDALQLALDGSVQPHQRFLLEMQLRRIEDTEKDLERLDVLLGEKLAPYDEVLGRLMRIPGVDWVIAATIIAEIGVDMSHFVSAAHLASWTGICPGNRTSAGKSQGGGTRKGNVYLKSALVTAGLAAGKKRGTYLADKHRRLRSRRGPTRAALATGHKILVAVYHMLKDGTEYQDLGATYLDTLDTRRVVNRSVQRLEALGYEVQVTKRAA